MEKERRHQHYFGDIGKSIMDILGNMGLDQKASEWRRWSSKPLDGGEFPLYGTYSFPAEWAKAIEAKVSDFDRSSPRRNAVYARMLFQVGCVAEAVRIAAQVLRSVRTESTRKWISRDVAGYGKWLKAFPRGIDHSGK